MTYEHLLLQAFTASNVCGATGPPTTKQWFRSALFSSIEQNPVQLSLVSTLLMARMVADQIDVSRRFSQNCEKRLLPSSVRPSVRPHETTRLPLDRLSLNLIFEDFSKIR